MKHRDFKKLNFAERYIQGKLSPEEKDKFEIHYMDCDRCFRDVKAANRYISAINKVAKQGYFDKAEEVKERSILNIHAMRLLKSPVALTVAALLILAILFPLYKGLLTRSRVTFKNDIPFKKIEVFEVIFESPVRGEKEVIKEIPFSKNVLNYEFKLPPSPEIERDSRVFAEIVDDSGEFILDRNKIFASEKDKYYSIKMSASKLAPGSYAINMYVFKNGNYKELGKYYFLIESK